MFKTTIRADERTDVAETIAALRHNAQRGGVPAADTALITSSIETTLNDLVARGRDMIASGGTTVSAKRTLKGADYEVQLIFGAGEKPSLLRRLASVFQSR